MSIAGMHNVHDPEAVVLLVHRPRKPSVVYND